MNTIGHILVVLMTLGAITQAAELEKTPAVLLQEALYQEETAGNLDKAIELYGQVLDQAADVERLAARATYQLGLCHLKKGDDTAAAEYFRKAVNEYPRQTSVVKKAQTQLDKIAPAGSSGGLYDQASEAVWSIIGSMYGQTCAKAGIKNLYTNSNIHFVNSDFIHWHGGYGYYMNSGTEPVSGRVRLSGTTNPNQQHFDILGNPLETEIMPDETPGRERFYNIYLDLPQPVAPMSFYPYAWAFEGSNELPSGVSRNRQLVMQNRFGSHAFEVFYLVVPNEIIIAETSEPHTDKQTFGDFTIYAWEKEVHGDNHLVMVSLSKDENGNIKTWVEDFFKHNYRDITARKTFEWGEPTTDENGNISIRYKYEATIWDKDKMISDHVFTFDKDGKFISVVDATPDPLRAENLVAEGWKLWQQRKLSEAEDKFYQAGRSDPTNDGAYQGLGWAQLNQGKKQNAEVSFKKCIELNPENSAALNGLGWIAHGQDKKDEAIEWWEKAVKASNGTATASLSGLTQTYMEMNDYAKAVKYYEMWLKVEPDSEDAKTGLEKAKAAMQ